MYDVTSAFLDIIGTESNETIVYESKHVHTKKLDLICPKATFKTVLSICVASVSGPH